MAQPPAAPRSLDELFAALEKDRSFTSYKSRLKACERIQARGHAWNAALISLATATTVAAVGLLVDDTMYGTSGEAFLAACSILALAVSLVVSSRDYPSRAVRMEANYKQIQALSLRVEAARSTSGNPTFEKYNQLDAEYVDMLTHSENHSTADYHASQNQKSAARVTSWALTFLPYLTLVLPGWLLWQFGDWVISGAR
ncbi:SLATT domain-containing protein [Nocardioides plantarum]|uniref:SLATT domain-containing protein n=1 Tax=Nocardioides plantarum TaxID=29299 RepID=A0ABV5KGM9_9ACTN|nr:SLATT domain-containing protein [Nocardioides plantarum]